MSRFFKELVALKNWGLRAEVFWDIKYKVLKASQTPLLQLVV